MTFSPVVVNRVYTGAHDRMGRFLLELRDVLVGTGLWKVTGSGDGGSAFANEGQTAGPSYDVFTAAPAYYVGSDISVGQGTRANSISRANAWLQLKEVGSTRTLQFRRTSSLTAGTTSNYTDMYAFRLIPGGVANTGATSTRAPAAVGAYYQHQGDTSSVAWSAGSTPITDNTFAPNTTQDAVVHFWVETEARAKGVCPFAWAIFNRTLAKMAHFSFYESLVDAPAAEDHPYLLRFQDAALVSQGHGTVGAGSGGPFYESNVSCCAYGAACGRWAFDAVSVPGFGVMPGTVYQPIGPDGKWRSFYPRARNASYQAIGRAEHIMANLVSRGYPATYDLASAAPWAAFGQLLMPWKQGEAPIAGV